MTSTQKKAGKFVLRCVVIILIFLLSLLFILPFWWLVTGSLQSMSELLKLPPNLFPRVISFRAYREALYNYGSNFNFLAFFKNSTIVAVITTASQILISSMAGYGFTRFRFPGRDKLFMLLLAGMMVPAQVYALPLYLYYSKLGITNTLTGLILPFLSSVFGMFLFRQTFVTIPRDMEEAAYLDGASYRRIFFTIMLPEVKSTIAAFGITAFNTSWNSYFLPLILSTRVHVMTLPVGITLLKNVQSSIDYAMLYATVVLATLPIFIVFIFFQKYFVQGLSGYAIKG